MFTVHVRDLTFISGGGGDGAGIEQEAGQASHRSLRLCFNICKY